jgi:hypothetical protein
VGNTREALVSHDLRWDDGWSGIERIGVVDVGMTNGEGRSDKINRGEQQRLKKISISEHASAIMKLMWGFRR